MISMNEPDLSDAALAELLTLTMSTNRYGDTIYHNHLGLLHRVHGPAVILPSGSTMWYMHGKRHRTDGPAVKWTDGDVTWFLNGEEFTEEEWNERVKSI